jgi:hypothetical protein
VRPGASARRAARHRLLRLHRAFGCLGTSRGSSRGSSRRSSLTTSPTPRVRVPWHVTRLVAPLVVDFFTYTVRPGASARRAAHRRLLRLRRVRVPRHLARLVTRLVVDFFVYTVRPGASARRVARHRLLRLRCAFGCLGTSRGSSRGSSHRSSLTTSPTPHVQVPRHVTRLFTWLVVDYFTYAARSGASACHAAHRATCRRLLQLLRASGCLSTSRGSSRGSSRHSSLTSSPTSCVWVPRHIARLVTPLILDFFPYAVCPGASARRAARHTAHRAARRRLHRLHRASGCLGTLRGSSRCSASTSSPTPCIRVPRHVARLVVNYFAYAVRLGASARRTARHTARRRLLCASRLRLAATLALLQPRRAL